MRTLHTVLGLQCLVASALASALSDEQLFKFIKSALNEKLEQERLEVLERRRQLGLADNTNDYSGVAIRNPNAIVTMGTDGDVALARTGQDQLQIMANVNISGSLKINGEKCERCFTESEIRQIVTDILSATLPTNNNNNTNQTSSDTESGSCSATCAGHTCDQLWTILDKSCATLESADCDCSGCLCEGDALGSCDDILSADPSAADGEYTIEIDGESEEVMCDMTTEGGGWTLVATITSGGTNWEYGDDDGNQGDLDSAWESDNTFGEISFEEDYKSRAFNDMAKSQIMISYNGDHLLTTDICHAGKSLKETFNDLQFQAGESSDCVDGNWKYCIDEDHKCDILTYDDISSEIALVHSSSISHLYLKWGEAEGAEDSNKDRVYLSTEARGTSTNILDYCQGLGSFVSFSGTEYTVNVGEEDDGAVAAGDGHNYGIWIRECDCSRCSCVDDLHESCEAILEADSSSDDGEYMINLNGQPEAVLCNMSNGGWTLAATITSAGNHWEYGDNDGDQGDWDSAWENNSTFGIFNYASMDFKGKVYNQFKKSEIMISYNGEHLLTTDTCHEGESLKETFNKLQFSAGLSDECTSSNWKTCIDSDHKCSIVSFDSPSDELALVHLTDISELYLKWGEADGTEDANKDRVYISTDARGASSNLLDYCQGLGSFVSFSGTEYTVNVGEEDDGAESVGSGHDYRLWVK